VQKIKRALLSVSDKTGLIPFARSLHQLKVEILSTGGTLKTLRQARIPARSVSDFTGFPEILEGRVKTLHPKIHGGILFRRNKKLHVRQARQQGIAPIDLVVVNLYPFEEVTKKKVSLETAIENIDIGGPTLLRSAAKNHESVAVVTDPLDYPLIVEEMKKYSGKVSAATRARLAQKVFEKTSRYDRLIADYLARFRARPSRSELSPRTVPDLPEKLDLLYERDQVLRYGENPHQRGALYRNLEKLGLNFKVLHGKEISFNNLLDFEATLDVLSEFDRPTACVVKHTNPSGIAEDKNLTQAVERAIACDPMSAFGGIVGLNRLCDLKTAKKIYERLNFLEIIVAPSFEPEAFEFLKGRKNVRLIQVGQTPEGGWNLRFTKFGVLLQDRDRTGAPKLQWVTKARLAGGELKELLFAWKCVKTVRSNAIVISQGYQTVGIGAGQMSRVDSVQIAIQKAGPRARGGFLASDAFFPMADSIELAGRAGIRAVVQPGGSIRDKEVIGAADRTGIAMAFTGERHFRH